MFAHKSRGCLLLYFILFCCRILYMSSVGAPPPAEASSSSESPRRPRPAFEKKKTNDKYTFDKKSRIIGISIVYLNLNKGNCSHLLRRVPLSASCPLPSPFRRRARGGGGPALLLLLRPPQTWPPPPRTKQSGRCRTGGSCDRCSPWRRSLEENKYKTYEISWPALAVKQDTLNLTTELQ